MLLPPEAERGTRGGRENRGREEEEALGLQLANRGSLSLSALGETGSGCRGVTCFAGRPEPGDACGSFVGRGNGAAFTMHQSLTQQRSSDMSLPDSMGKCCRLF